MALPMKVYVILHNIRSAHNVGAIFRTADGAGVSKIFLSGYTPSPVDRFGRPRGALIKTALGATETVPWESAEDTEGLISRLRGDGVEVVSVEQHVQAVPYTEHKPQGDVAYIFGNEIEGVPQSVIQHADVCIHIPMHGKKESLNVSTAVGVILFQAIQ
jgi:23S rRNA (guanosine2251-2'-O)-methyltransferase